MTTESSKNGAMTMSRMNFSGYVEQPTIFSRMLATECCFGSTVGDTVKKCLVG